MATAMACASGAGVLAQAPSFSGIPGVLDITESTSNAVSPNGRYVFVSTFTTVIESNRGIRYDRLSGQQLSFSDRGYSMNAVLDSGVVYGYGRLSVFDPFLATRWTPETGQIVQSQRLGGGVRDFLIRVSPDGLWGLGYSRAGSFAPDTGPDSPSTPTLFDLSRPNALLPIDLDAGSGNVIETIAGLTLPTNGLPLSYATAVGNGTRTGLAWFGANATPMVQTCEVYDVTPKGDLVLGKVGASFFVRGNGQERYLTAPTSPFLMSDPTPKRMSADGSVVVGTSLAPWLRPGGGNPREGVIWRAGQPPAMLRTLLENAGVAVPAWPYGSFVNDVSADGSVVVGTYLVQNPALPAGFSFPRAYVAVLPAANDNCQTAREVTYGTTISSTNGATRAGGAGWCSSEGGAPDVWFRFVPAANETVTIDTCGSTFDTTLTVFQTSSCASLGNPVACNDDGEPACSQSVLNSRVSVGVFAGSTYYIRVSGWNESFGSIQLNITAPARPSNDNCAQATNMNPGSGWFWNNSSAITDTRPNCPGAGTPFSDLWYRTTPTETGRMTYSTCNSSINTVMAVYPGGACGDVNMPAIACVNSNGSCGTPGARITVPCTAGDQQLIRIGGLFGATGAGQITARFACDQNNLNNYAVAVVNSGARAFWRFEDSGSQTAADAIRGDPFTCGDWPGQYTGTNNRRRGAQGLALNLNGAGHVQVETLPAIRLGDTSLCAQTTLEAWVRTTDPNAGVVLTNRNTPDQSSLTMVVGWNPIGVPDTAGRAMFVIDGPGIFFGAISSSRIDDGRWHHIVGRRIPRSFGIYTYIIYVDGVQEGSSNIGGGPADNNAPGGAYWYIGNGPAWSSFIPGFNGSIDEAAIYCRAIPPTEIVNHYNLGRPCVADMDDGSGTGNPDGGVTIEDLLYYLGIFSDGVLAADIDDGSSTGRRDGGVTIDDLLYFILRFEGGC